MAELNTSIFIWKKIAKVIEADRLRNAGKTTSKRQKTITLTQKESNELSKKQEKNKRAIAEAIKRLPKHKKQKMSSKPINPRDMQEIDKAIERIKNLGASPLVIEQVRQDLINQLNSK